MITDTPTAVEAAAETKAALRLQQVLRWSQVMTIVVRCPWSGEQCKLEVDIEEGKKRKPCELQEFAWKVDGKIPKECYRVASKGLKDWFNQKGVVP